MRMSPAVVAQLGGALCAVVALFVLLSFGWALLILGLALAGGGTWYELVSATPPAAAPVERRAAIPRTVLDGVDPRGEAA